MKTANQVYALCPKCTDHVPILFPNEKNELNVQCECSYSELLELDKFVDDYNKNQKRESTVKRECDEHKEMYTHFCEECNKTLCTKCKEGHSHQAKPFEELCQLINFDRLKVDFAKAEEYLNVYFPSLKEKYKDVPGINEAYDKCIKTNTAIIKFRKILIDNLIVENAMSLQELYMSSHFNLYPYVEKGNPNTIIDYFNGFNFYFVRPYNTIFVSNGQDIHCIAKLNDNRIAFCHDNPDIFIMDPSKNTQKNKDCVVDLTLKGHSETVLCLAVLPNGNLISASKKNDIKVWSITQNESKCLATVENAHQSEIRKIEILNDNTFATCGDSSIKIWNSDATTKKEIKVEIGTVDSILYIKEKNILVAGVKNKILTYDLKDYKLIDTITVDIVDIGRKGIINIDNERLIIGGKNVLCVVNLVTKTVEEEWKNTHLLQMNVLIKLRDSQFILGGTDEGNFALYNVNTKEMRTITVAVDGVCAIAICDLVNLDDNTIVMGNGEGNLRIWKY